MHYDSDINGSKGSKKLPVNPIGDAAGTLPSSTFACGREKTMNINFKDNNSRINYNEMKTSSVSLSLEEALRNTNPFELSDEVILKNKQILVDIPEELLKHVR